MTRNCNFSAGPAALPTAVLEKARDELLDYRGTGMSIMEQSHRAAPFSEVLNRATDLVAELLNVPDSHQVMFLSGGASTQFAMIPMNLRPGGKSADYIVTGVWGQKALAEARTIGEASVAIDTSEKGAFLRIPRSDELSLDPNAAYVHYTTNNTIAGTQWFEVPEVGNIPLIADMSSDIFWRPIDVSKFGLIYAGAQKNIGPSGITLAIIRKDLLKLPVEHVPKIFRYATHAASGSLYNTPPTFAIYLVREVLELLKKNGGVKAAETRNRHKAQLLYDAIDARPNVFRCPVEKKSRSVMNVVFRLANEDLEARFVAEAASRNLMAIRGHRSVGGIRVSIYNAAPVQWVEAIVSFMDEFRV